MLFFAKKSMLFRFAVLSDMWAVDFPARKRRFEINCRLGRYIRRNPNEYDGWLTFKTSVPSNIHPKLFSLSPIFKASAWLEREIWDMFGVYFTYNPELRRILTDYGFEGFPLRKDFPVTGYLALRYDFSRKKTVLEPVDFTFGQEYRYFDFQSPWRFKKSFK
jgi:NADH-quinone oxidoreductase subunit C